MAQVLTPDICVIGAGAAGMAAAMHAARATAKTVLVEKARLGGSHPHSACIPTQAFIACAKTIAAARQARQFGLKIHDVGVDFAAVLAHVQHTVQALSANYTVERLQGMGVDVIEAPAQFIDEATISAGDTLIRARKFILATGSKPYVPPIPGLDKAAAFTHEGLLDRVARLGKLVVLGGDGAGLGLAQAYKRFGSHVTVMEPEKVLPFDDQELREPLLDHLRREGLGILEGARIERIEPFGQNTRIIFVMENKSYSVECTHILISLGRVPCLSGLNLEAAGVKFNAKGVLVDKTLKTANAKIYAIGDVTGLMNYTHVAHHHADVAVQNALFGSRVAVDHETLPWVSFTDPELAHVGLTEENARQRHGDLTLLRWPFAENERAHIEKETAGFVKVYGARSGKILGASAFGACAGEIIQMWSLAMQKGLTLDDMRSIVCPFPTWMEVNKRAASSHALPHSTPSSIMHSFKALLAYKR